MILVSQTCHLGQAFLAFSLCTVLLQNGAGNNGSRVMNFSSRPSLLSGCSRRVLCFGAGNDDARVTDLSPRPSLLDVLVVYCVFGA